MLSIERGRGTMADYRRWHVNNCQIDQRTLIEHYGLAYYDVATTSFKVENGGYTVRVENASDFFPVSGSFKLL